MLEGLAETLKSFASTVLNLLPESPFVFLERMTVDSQISAWLGMLNWFIPVNTFVAILQTWLVGIAIYYVWQIVLRWIKAIE